MDQLTELLVDLDDLHSNCEPAERRILNRTLFTHITIDDEENATHISAEATVSVLAHTNIDASAQVTAETKLPHHQAGQASIFSFYLEHRGFEPLTSSMPWKRATNCANAPKTTPQEGHPLRSPDRPGDQANVTGSHPSSPNRTKPGQYLRMGIDTHSCATHLHRPKKPSTTAPPLSHDSYCRGQLCTSVAFR